MAEEHGPGEEPHGSLYKATEVGLGIASVAAIVLSFFPGANEIGAIIQGGITLVQTGMELATGHKKQAAKTFAIGSLLTVASIIPFLGAAGNLAKGGELAADGVKEVGVLGRMWNAITGAGKTVAKQTGKAFDHLPGASSMRNGVGAVNEHLVSPITKGFKTAGGNAKSALGKWHKGNLEWVNSKPALAKKAAWLADHSKTAMGMELGANAAGIGWSMMDGDTPPGNLTNPDTYDISDAPTRRWRDRIEQERAIASTQQH